MQKWEKGGGREKRGRGMEGGGVREKALSWDPPARDFLPLMYFPPFFFLPQRNLSWAHCIFLANTPTVHTATFTSNTTADLLSHVLPRPAPSAQQLTANLTLERGMTRGKGKEIIKGQEKKGESGGNEKGASLAEAMQRQYDANAT